MNSYRALREGWVLTADDGPAPAELAGRRIPATVPGCVHTDLLAAKLIGDPYLDDNEDRLEWIGRTDWRYETDFVWRDSGPERVDLVCDGLDTVAEITLNGHVLGRTANMHRSYRFDARDALHTGENRLAIRFTSALRHAEQFRDALGERPRAYPHPFNFIRKMACNFGWDWGPALITAGIWRPIGLHEWGASRLAAVRPLVAVADGVGRVTVHVHVERAAAGGGPLLLTGRVGGAEARVSVPPGATEAVLELTVNRPELWQPRGYGGQPLYRLDVTLAGADGTSLDAWSRSIGFRSVRLDTAAGPHGSGFAIAVNDTPVFVRGANWIPDECLPSRVGRDRYAQRLAQACQANLNLVRVWGGGLYESEDFYELCDELGLLVWQDFAFACAAYPEEAPLASEVEAEAREAVTRLASHPSLVLWNGNNENIWGWQDWGWQEPLAGSTWGRGYYLDLLPRIVGELDPTRPYWPGSPYSGDIELPANDDRHGVSHVWDVWNERDYVAYRERVPRFAAEFGFQGPAAYSTLRRATPDEPLRPDSPGMRRRQKAVDGDRKLTAWLAAHFREPETFDDWLYLTQLNQARAISLGVEHFRSHAPRCMGTVIWQLNDCWPVTSWSMVDGDGRRKPAWYALRRSYADRLVTVQPREGGLALVAVNDSPQEWAAEIPVIRYDLTGTPLQHVSVTVAAPPRSVCALPLPEEVVVPGDPSREFLGGGAGLGRAWWFYAADKDVAYPPAAYHCDIERTGDGAHVTVTAATLLRDLAIFADRIDPGAEVDDMLITLLPGESATFRVSGLGDPSDDTLSALTAPPVLRCVNDQTRGSY